MYGRGRTWGGTCRGGARGPTGVPGGGGLWVQETPGCQARPHRMPFLIQKAEETLVGSNFVLTQQQGFLGSLPSCSPPAFPGLSWLGTPRFTLTPPLHSLDAQPQSRTEFRGPGALARVSSVKRKR